jgi:hypothetical protein
MLRYAQLCLVAALLLSGCSSSDSADSNSVNPDSTPGSSTPDTPAVDAIPSVATWYQPPVGITWQWQLSGPVNTSYDAGLYDVDLFDVDIAQISQLQSEARRVICYFSAGSYEQWRPDADQFSDQVLGNALDGWPGERWLDIRDATVRSIMQQRLNMAVEKGCTGVEPDNVDGYSKDTGINLSAEDQLDFNRFLASEAHARNLSIGLKNDLEQIAELVNRFDFAVNEQCFEFDECALLQPFIDAGKAVLNAEYDANLSSDMMARDALCQAAQGMQFSTLILPLELDDAFRLSCS